MTGVVYPKSPGGFSRAVSQDAMQRRTATDRQRPYCGSGVGAECVRNGAGGSRMSAALAMSEGDSSSRSHAMDAPRRGDRARQPGRCWRSAPAQARQARAAQAPGVRRRRVPDRPVRRRGVVARPQGCGPGCWRELGSTPGRAQGAPRTRSPSWADGFALLLPGAVGPAEATAAVSGVLDALAEPRSTLGRDDSPGR